MEFGIHACRYCTSILFLEVVSYQVREQVRHVVADAEGSNLLLLKFAMKNFEVYRISGVVERSGAPQP
jgi:hypothetical protein